MLRTFNCGIGMIAVLDRAGADAASECLAKNGETVVRLGEVVAGGGAPSNIADTSICRGEPDGQKARRRAHLRPWLEHDGADRCGQGTGLSGGNRARRIEPARCAGTCPRARGRNCDRADRSPAVRRRPRSLRTRARRRAERATHRPRLPCGIHAALHAVVRHALERAPAEHPPGAVAAVQGARYPSPRARSRRRHDTAPPCTSSSRKPIRGRSSSRIWSR